MNAAKLAGYVLVFVISALLIAYGWVMFELDRAQTAVFQGDMAGAMETYARVERPLNMLPWLTQILAAEHKQASLNQVALLYSQRKIGDALAKLEQLPVDAPAVVESADYSFWMGNVLFRQAIESPRRGNRHQRAQGRYVRIPKRSCAATGRLGPEVQL